MGFTSLEGDVRRRWRRVAQLAIDSDELRSLRLAIALVCEAPQDSEARERMRGIAAEHRAWEQLAPLLAAEARLTRDPDVVAALDEESARARSQIEHPPPPLPALREAIERDPDNPEHLEMLAWSYYLAGVWTKAAETLEELAGKVPSEHAILPLHAAARLYRNTGHTERAQTTYRGIVVRKPSNTEALIAISELISDAPALNHTSPFDPPVSDEVIESQVVLADVAARTPTAEVTVPDEPAAESEAPAEPPKPRKRVQVFDRIDEAELDARFASVFDEGDSPAATAAPEPKPEPGSGVVEPVERAESAELVIEPGIEPAEPEAPAAPSTPPDARPIAAIRLQTARVPRAATPPPIPVSEWEDRQPAPRPRAMTPAPVSEPAERSAPVRPIPRAAMPVPRASTPSPAGDAPLPPARPPSLPRAITPRPLPASEPAATDPALPRVVSPPLPRVPREPSAGPISKQIVAVEELDDAPPAATIEHSIDVAIEQAMDSTSDATTDEATELVIDDPLNPMADEPLHTSSDDAIASALDLAFDQATDRPTAIPRQIPRESSIGIVAPDVKQEIDAAKADARAGRVAIAEQRLRTLIAARPLETAVQVSLVDLLRANNRLDDADAFLRDALERAPVEASAHRAALLHRHALVTASRGDGEQAHTMLRQAHDLDPMSLPITLALGESYYARQAWGEAVRHLAPVATHPDAASLPRSAARGLVTAALAEIELRRPNQATQLYQAALRIDPSCEPARRALTAK